MIKDRFLFLPKVSTKPNKIVCYNEVFRKNWDDNDNYTLSGVNAGVTRTKNLSSNKIAPEKKFHNFKVSDQAQKNIKEKVNWLYSLARSRYKKSLSGKEIFNFKINFLTLTLPSKQKHTTAEITSVCFNQFLVELRKKYQFENYVWRLEFQKNGNVHYHIVTDSFLDYEITQRIWNRCIEKLNYVSEYRYNMSALSVTDYVKKYTSPGANDYEKLRQRYAKGKYWNWSNPPTIDLKICTSNKAIASYISKYFSKADKSGCIKNDLDNEQNSFSLRLWFCSRSLSKLEAIREYIDEIEFRPDILIKFAENVRTYVYDYAIVYYFDIVKLSDQCKRYLYPYLRNYANELCYKSAE